MTVADTPPIVNGNGTDEAESVEFARFLPKTLNAIPGAKASWNDAPLATLEMTVVVDPPIVKVTGTWTNCGMVFSD